MEYDNTSFIDKQKAIELFKTGDSEIVCKTLIDAISYIHDRQWLQDKCIELSQSSDFWISKTAINCIGDIARIYKKLDAKKVKYLFSELKKKRKELLGTIEDVEDDFEIYL